MQKMTLGIPSGSLYEATLKLLQKVGIEVNVNGRNFIVEITGSEVFDKAIIMRPNDLPLALNNGIVDVAITGYDMLMESELEKDLCIIQKLGYAKKSKSSAKVVLFCREDDSDEIVDSKETLVSSEYLGIAKNIFKKAKIVFSTGSTEVKIADERFGFRYGIGITETGKSLEDNGLKILKFLVAPVVLLARGKITEVEIIGQILKGALDAETFQLLKFNADLEAKEALIKTLPAMESLTVNTLADGAIAIETAITKNVITDIVVAIKKLGGRNILIQNINVVL